ncbi:MAG: DUF2924 domain-containing protein [Armatimonadetes bacterium]|nr:DUF2924 domain-containing protein [Armatimonadota bacterium]
MESLFLRISKPRGNTITPRLVASEDLHSSLRRQIRERQRAELEEIAPGGARRKKTKKKAKSKKAARTQSARQPTLAPYVTKRFAIRWRYKGTMHRATVRSNGTINYNGSVYTSPSTAAQAIAKRPISMDGTRGASRIPQASG